MEQPGVAGTGAGGAESLSECHADQRIKVNPVTGAKYVEATGRPRFLQLIPAKDGNPGFNARPEVKLRFPVEGLKAFRKDDFTMAWEWTSDEPHDAAEAVDAQCRAGWQDDQFGFFGYRWARKGEKFFCSWESWVSCE